jgi:hypothetical protein
MICYRVLKSPPLVPVISQMNPVHFSKIQLSLILQPTSRSSYLILSSGFFTTILYTLRFFPMRTIRPAHLIILGVINSNFICRRLQATNLLIMHFSPVSYYIIHLRPKYSPQHPVLKDLQSVRPLMSETSFIPIQNYRHNYNAACFNFSFSDSRRGDKNS